MAVVRYRLRAVARQRWLAWLALALLVGLGGGIVLGALAAARRTDSAYGRFLKDANAFDVGVSTTAVSIDFEPLRRLPQVADVAGVTYVVMEKDGGDQGAGLSPLLPAGDGLYDRISRPKVLEGRRADPSRADEVTISRLAAEGYGLSVGGTLAMRSFAPEQLETVLSGDFSNPDQ